MRTTEAGAGPTTTPAPAGGEASQPEPPAISAGRGPTARILLAVIHLYQLARTGRVSPCRFTPTCSHYAVEAIERHGARRGLTLTLRRLGRCRPGGPFGSDPVPE
jgi:putative membrane protein insertion efficiency factor